MGGKHKKQFSFYISQWHFIMVFFRVFVPFPVLFFCFLQIPRSLAGWMHSRTIVQCLGVAVWIENRLEAGSHLGRWAPSAAGEPGLYISIYIYWYLWMGILYSWDMGPPIWNIECTAFCGSSCATFWSRLAKAISFGTCLKRGKFSLFMSAG